MGTNTGGAATESDSSGGTFGSRFVAALLTVIAVALVVIAVNSHRLVIEQQRTTCYERLSWLTPGEEERPGGMERSSSARLCEGNSPLTEFSEP